MFWLCKFVFGSHPYYVVKPLYFHFAIKIAAKVSLPLAPMFLGHLYVQLNILRSDESHASSCHIVTSSIHSTLLQHLLYEHCAKHLLKCRHYWFLWQIWVRLSIGLLLGWFEANWTFCHWIIWSRRRIFLESLQKFGYQLYMCRFYYGFVRWHRWDYHSLD